MHRYRSTGSKSLGKETSCNFICKNSICYSYKITIPHLTYQFHALNPLNSSHILSNEFYSLCPGLIISPLGYATAPHLTCVWTWPFPSLTPAFYILWCHQRNPESKLWSFLFYCWNFSIALATFGVNFNSSKWHFRAFGTCLPLKMLSQ